MEMKVNVVTAAIGVLTGGVDLKLHCNYNQPTVSRPSEVLETIT